MTVNIQGKQIVRAISVVSTILSLVTIGFYIYQFSFEGPFEGLSGYVLMLIVFYFLSQGKNWARIVSILFFGLSGLVSVGGFDSTGIFGLLILFVIYWTNAGLLLFSKDVKAFFKQ